VQDLDAKVGKPKEV